MTDHDTWLEAPYANQQEGEECEDCGGTGSVRVHGPEDYGVSFESEECERCGGTGYIDPPTREEIKERMDEERFDRMRDEGEI